MNEKELTSIERIQRFRKIIEKAEERKNNLSEESNYVKHFEKDYCNCSNGKAKVQLGEYDDGDGYHFDIDIYLEGLYDNPDNGSFFNPFKPVNINIKGRGIEELRVMRDMFKDISEYINENI